MRIGSSRNPIACGRFMDGWGRRVEDAVVISSTVCTPAPLEKSGGYSRRHSSSPAASRKWKAVVFDLGGVFFDSPFPAIADYEKELQLPPNAINRVIKNTGSEGAFGRLERGLLDMKAFSPAFEQDCAAAGLEGVSGGQFMMRVDSALKLRPLMLCAAQRLRVQGYKTGILTNNYPTPPDSAFNAIVDTVLKPNIDVVVESYRCGLHKPDPAIFRHTCRLLQVPPDEVVFLDDIGQNLKNARSLGMETIKVAGEDHSGSGALRQLETLLGCRLLDDMHRIVHKAKL